ncbi:MAG: hypothetical protein P1P84_12370 [Deferrisomatales bacterium]|nr:hypothetical protein [Deferrisomatales bacterium]
MPDWGAYLYGHPEAAIYHAPRWGCILRDACGGNPFFLTARRGGEVVGVLLLVGQNILLFGSRLTSTPYFDAAGILIDAPEAAAVLARELREAEGYAVLELRQLAPAAEAAATRTDKVTLCLEIPHGSEAMWEQFVAEGVEVPDVRPDSGKYLMMVEYLKKLTLPAARTLGP